MKQYAYFVELPIKTEFVLNGNLCVKRSTRTLFLPEFNRWFYTGKRELCIVAPYCRLSSDYFGGLTND